MAAAQMSDKQVEIHRDEPPYEPEPTISPVADFFQQAWPMMIFGFLFFFTMSLPIVFLSDFPLLGVLIFAAGLLGLGLAVALPWVFAPYVLLLAVIVPGLTAYCFKTYDVMGPVFYTVLITFYLLGNLVLPSTLRRRK